MEENYYEAKLHGDSLMRGFRDLLATDQAREDFRREAALYVLLRLDADLAAVRRGDTKVGLLA